MKVQRRHWNTLSVIIFTLGLFLYLGEGNAFTSALLIIGSSVTWNGLPKWKRIKQIGSKGFAIGSLVLGFYILVSGTTDTDVYQWFLNQAFAIVVFSLAVSKEWVEAIFTP